MNQFAESACNMVFNFIHQFTNLLHIRLCFSILSKFTQLVICSSLCNMLSCCTSLSH